MVALQKPNGRVRAQAGRRLGAGLLAHLASSSKSLTGGSAPSTHVSPNSGSCSRLAASARCLATARRAVQRRTYACTAAPRGLGAPWHVRAGARRQPQPRDQGRPERRLRRNSGKRGGACGGGPGARRGRVCGRPSTVSSDRADEGGVNRDLHAAPNGQDVGHNLQAAAVKHRHVKVEVAREHVLSNAGSSFAADPGSGALQGHTAPKASRAPRRSWLIETLGLRGAGQIDHFRASLVRARLARRLRRLPPDPRLCAALSVSGCARNPAMGRPNTQQRSLKCSPGGAPRVQGGGPAPLFLLG